LRETDDSWEHYAQRLCAGAVDEGFVVCHGNTPRVEDEDC